MTKTKEAYKKYRKAMKKKRERRQKALGIEDKESALMRNYGLATRTRRAIKTELFGNKGKSKDTSIEEFVENFLKEKEIEFIPQKALKWCNYDFYLVEEKVAIECEGDYWHCNPRVYPEGPKNNIQKLNLEKNKMKIEICEKVDVPLLKVWELDIKKDENKVKEQILEFIEKNKNKGFIVEETNWERD